jgi:hypothetical protein
VLTVFGLLRASISGLGTNMNYFAQAWTSLGRISDYINTAHSTNPLNQPLIPSQPNPTSKYLTNERIQDQTQIPTLSTLLQIANKPTRTCPFSSFSSPALYLPRISCTAIARNPSSSANPSSHTSISSLWVWSCWLRYCCFGTFADVI